MSNLRAQSIGIAGAGAGLTASTAIRCRDPVEGPMTEEFEHDALSQFWRERTSKRAVELSHRSECRKPSRTRSGAASLFGSRRLRNQADSAGYAAALFAAHRFFRAATMAFRPAALSFRFAFFNGAAFAAGTDSPFTFAHRRCCASRMR